MTPGVEQHFEFMHTAGGRFGSAPARWPTDGRFRRVSPIALHPGEGRLTERRPVVRPWWQEPYKCPEALALLASNAALPGRQLTPVRRAVLLRLQVGRVEAFGKLVVDRLQKCCCIGDMTLIAQQPGKAGGGAEFPGDLAALDQASAVEAAESEGTDSDMPPATHPRHRK